MAKCNQLTPLPFKGLITYLAVHTPNQISMPSYKSLAQRDLNHCMVSLFFLLPVQLLFKQHIKLIVNER